jgi:hypothetical protein
MTAGLRSICTDLVGALHQRLSQALHWLAGFAAHLEETS